MRQFVKPLALAAASTLAVPAALAQSTATVAVIEIEGTPAEQSGGMSWMEADADTIRGLVETFDTLAFDDEFDGVLIKLKDAMLGTTHVEEIGAAIARLRDSGKPVHLFSENYGTGQLLLGSRTDGMIMQQGGGVSLPGMYMEEMYLADMLEWVGVKAQLVQVGDYKGANEMMTRSSPSEAWDESISTLLDGMYANVRETLMDGREMSGAELDEAMRVAWWASGRQAIDVGLIDFEVDLADLSEVLSDQYDVDDVEYVLEPYDAGSVMQADLSNPLSIFSSIFGEAMSREVERDTIAVLHINGTIIDGDSAPAGPLGGGGSVGSRTIRNTINEILAEDLIKGVILRIDSPGGSAIASEVMWQGITRLAEEKPVWVSVGSMAASGGYYVLAAGDRVFVNPSSVVGSIGVVGGKYALGDVMDKLKINVVERSRGPAASLNSMANPWNASEIAMVRDRMRETYDQFTSRVTAGRPGIDLAKTAEGRLFTGSQAIELDMADEIGGIDDAINGLAAELDLNRFDVLDYPAPPSFDEMLGNLLGSFIEAPGIATGAGGGPLASGGSIGEFAGALRGLLGEQRYSAVVDQLNAISLLRDERVLLVAPRAIIVR
ncbi:MAG: S49 family peptidase [Planctomycetota bacterium]